ncbi:MAG: hypothetical protein C4523_06020 [Myxococcales bacterium]|nr:MAG: hypothetical protein C4523_06020 [Myxococcales bacterium]
MRLVETRPPSFPEAPLDALLSWKPRERWQVVCGDEAHWRVGVYSPGEASRADVKELEKHDCPEFFLLLSGRLTLVMSENGRVRDAPLEIGKPILVASPHCGYCPDGPHTGVALVIERDRFVTEYRPVTEW